MREELKYVIPDEVLDGLRREISPFVELDEYGAGFEERGYTVRSIYLDSPQLLYYHEKQAHLQNRKKLRIRGYNENGSDDRVFLEIKRKFSSAIAKDRAPMAFSDLTSLFQSNEVERFIGSWNGFPKAREAARNFFYHVCHSNLRPTNLVVYEREAFLGRFDPTLRLTFDRTLRGRMYPELMDLFVEHELLPVMPGNFILEVKFNTAFPSWLRPILAKHGLMQRAASKYCMVIDLFDQRKQGITPVLAGAASVREGIHANGHAHPDRLTDGQTHSMPAANGRGRPGAPKDKPMLPERPRDRHVPLERHPREDPLTRRD